MRFIHAILCAASLTSVALACSCNPPGGSCRSVSFEDSIVRADSIAEARGLPPHGVNAVRRALGEDDAALFAAAVSYPLARPYPLRDIDDSLRMTVYYPVMVDDSLRRAVVTASDSAWSDNGWRGWTLHDGRYLWIDDKLYRLDYISQSERAMLHTLADEEIHSLAPDMRKGWSPAFCLHGLDDGTVYRVDARRSGRGDVDRTYRLSIYMPGRNLRRHPSQTMRGRLDTDGSAGVRTYRFRGRDGSRATYVYDRMTDLEPNQIVIISARGDSAAHPVERAYWRDLLPCEGDSVSH